MRKRAWGALACAAATLLLALLGNATDGTALYLLSGLALFAAVGLAISLLRFWARLRLPPMRLFPRPGPGEAWDPATGTVVRAQPRPQRPPRPPRRGRRRAPRPPRSK